MDDTQRYFRAPAGVYDAIRLATDAILRTTPEDDAEALDFVPFPANETTMEPEATAPKDQEGNILVAISIVSCNTEPFASSLTGALEIPGVVEITAEDYAESQIPEPEESLN